MMGSLSFSDAVFPAEYLTVIKETRLFLETLRAWGHLCGNVWQTASEWQVVVVYWDGYYLPAGGFSSRWLLGGGMNCPFAFTSGVTVSGRQLAWRRQDSSVGARGV